MITTLHRGGTAKWLQYYIGGGMPKWLQYYIGGGSLGTPKSDYVICARPLMCSGSDSSWIRPSLAHILLPEDIGNDTIILIMIIAMIINASWLLMRQGTPIMIIKIAKGTTNPRHWVLWFIQHIYVKAEALLSFKNHGQTSAWFCLRRGEKYIKQLWQIDATTLQTHVTT